MKLQFKLNFNSKCYARSLFDKHGEHPTQGNKYAKLTVTHNCTTMNYSLPGIK